jgi:GNAT superfamily N-acetyltransferase
MLGPGTSVNGNGSLVQRLTRLRERIKEDSETRRQLIVERDAWRSMTTLMTQTRAYVHELLEEAERGRDTLNAEVRSLRDQVLELQISHEHAVQEKRVSEETLHALRQRLHSWSGTVERALAQLNKAASEIVSEHGAHMMENDGNPLAPSAGNEAITGQPDAWVAPASFTTLHTTRRVRRTYLQLQSREQFRPGRRPRRQAVWLLLPAPTVSEWRQLYATVGAAWEWHDRDSWPDAQIAQRLANSEVHIFRADAALNSLSDDIEAGVGFVELERHPNGSVEIVYFGLTRNAQGFGLGAWLLERAVDEAWGLGATQVWLHTCTLDSPHALPNYIARGFEVEREEEYDAP